MMNRTNVYNGNTYQSTTQSEIINGREIKVKINIPENVPSRQQKINKIYDILKPKNA